MHLTSSRSGLSQGAIDSSLHEAGRYELSGISATEFVVATVCCTTEQSCKCRLVRDVTLEDERTRQLLCRVAEGHITAFWKLWDLHKAHLYNLCLWQMGVQEDAEDALSRAMLRALEKLPGNARKIGNFRAWLSRLTLNLCVDIHRERRRQMRRLESIENSLQSPSYRVPTRTHSPEEGLINREVFAHVCSAVDDLPRRLREPFVLRFFQEMDYREIADCLILSTDNVRKRIQQARDILREELNRFLHGSAGDRTGHAKRVTVPQNRVSHLRRPSSNNPPRFLGI